MGDIMFAERSIEVDGHALRYAEAGSGDALVCLGTRPSRAHMLMAERRRVIVFALPEEGSAIPAVLAHRIGVAVSKLGIERFDLMGHGAGGASALWLGLENLKSVGAIALVAPTVLRREGGEELERHLGELKRPVLALFGTNDPIAPPEDGDRYRAALPDCHLMFVYDAAHAIDIDRPEAVASIGLEFFERHDLFLVSRDSGITFP